MMRPIEWMIASGTGEPAASTTRPRMVPLKSLVEGLAASLRETAGIFTGSMDWVISGTQHEQAYWPPL
jgi:hypothetical protein